MRAQAREPGGGKRVMGTFATAAQQPAHAGGRGAARGAQTPALAQSTVEFRARNPEEALRQLTQAKDVADAQGLALRISMDQVVSARLGLTRAANNTAFCPQSSRHCLST